MLKCCAHSECFDDKTKMSSFQFGTNDRDTQTAEEGDFKVSLKRSTKGKETSKNLSLFCSRNFPVMSWFVDSGASEHMVNSQHYFAECRDLEECVTVVVAKAGTSLRATKIGTVCGYAFLNDEKMEYRIRDVLFVPDLQANLFSVPKAVKKKLRITFENNICKIVKRDKEVAIAVKDQELFELRIMLYCCRPASSTPGTVAGDRHLRDASYLHSTRLRTNLCNVQAKPLRKSHLQVL